MTLERNTFTGTFSKDNETFPVDFHAWAESDMRLKIEVEPLPTQTLFRLQGAMGEPGSYSQSLKLEGEAADGTLFFSERVNVRSAKFGSSGNSITVSALEATVTTRRPKPFERPVMRLWLRSFRSFRNPIVQMSLGRVQVWGNEKKVPNDEVSGSITVEATEGTDMTDWVTRADTFLTFMHRGLAFAHGSRLQTPRLDTCIEDLWKSTFYEGSAFDGNVSPIHHLNHGPFIEALVSRYDQVKPFPSMLWTAVGWLQIDTTFDEGRFLMSMTALETIVEQLIPDTLTRIMLKPEFAEIRDGLIKLVKGSSIPDTAQQIFIGKIKGLNARSLSQKIESLRDHYALSSKTFNKKSIVALTKLRNDIVHTGKAKESKIWPKILFVRELVSQIMFREVGYNGPYQSYIDGYNMVHPDPR